MFLLLFLVKHFAFQVILKEEFTDTFDPSLIQFPHFTCIQ